MKVKTLHFPGHLDTNTVNNPNDSKHATGYRHFNKGGGGGPFR